MAGTPEGALRTAAKRIGISLAVYQANIASGQKWCTKCKDWRPVSEFDKDKSRGDGLRAGCMRHYTRTRPGPTKRVRRQEEAVGKRWCRGCERWHPAAQVRKGACRVHQNADARAWYASGSEAARGRRGRAIARRRGLEPIPVWWAAEVRNDFEGVCAYGCGRTGDTWDHIWPVSRGGISAPGNLAPACSSCNSRKKNNDPTPWVERGLNAFPRQWLGLMDLAIATDRDDWCAWEEAPWTSTSTPTLEPTP